MIGYLKGELVWMGYKNIILSVQGVGYEIDLYNTYSTSDLNKEVILYIVHKRSDYDESMYGFASYNEKALFESLVGIKGMGARMVFNIMSELEIRSWEDLRDLPLDRLTKVSGVGRASAQKFLLGVSNKIKKEIDIESLTKDQSKVEDTYKDEINLLVEWGMKKGDIVDCIKENKDMLSTMKSEQIIQFLLKVLK